MPRHARGDMGLPRVADLPPDVATFMIARALAEVYRDVLSAPIPERLAAVLRRIESGERPHGYDEA